MNVSGFAAPVALEAQLPVSDPAVFLGPGAHCGRADGLGPWPVLALLWASPGTLLNVWPQALPRGALNPLTCGLPPWGSLAPQCLCSWVPGHSLEANLLWRSNSSSLGQRVQLPRLPWRAGWWCLPGCGPECLPSLPLRGSLPPEPEDGAGPRFALEPLPVPGSSWLPVSLGESGPGLLSLCPSSGRSFYWCIFFTGNEPFRNECRLVCIKMCQLLRNTCGWSVRPLQGLPTHGGGWQREASAFLHLRWWVPQVWIRRDPWGQGSPRHRGKHTAQSRGMVFSLVLVGGRG